MRSLSRAKPGPKAPLIKELSGRIGKYDIVKPLGKGAMGMVYLAHDTVLERDVALKVMVAQIADDPELKTALRARGQGRREDDPPERGERSSTSATTPTARPTSRWSS